MADLGKEMERARDEAGMDGDSLESAEAREHRLISETYMAREQYKGGDSNQRAAVNRAEAESATGRERDKDKRLQNILEE